MFKNEILKTKNIVKNHFNLVISAIIVFAVFFILGSFLIGTKNIKSIFEDVCINYYTIIISVDFSVSAFIIKNAFSLFLTFMVLSLLVSNKYTFYLSFLIIAYNGYVFGIFLNIFIFKLGLSGLIIFIFTLLIKFIVFIFAIILFLAYSKSLQLKNCKKIIDFFKLSLFFFVLSLIGVIIEAIFITVLLRPTNLIF